MELPSVVVVGVILVIGLILGLIVYQRYGGKQPRRSDPSTWRSTPTMSWLGAWRPEPQILPSRRLRRVSKRIDPTPWGELFAVDAYLLTREPEVALRRRAWSLRDKFREVVGTRQYEEFALWQRLFQSFGASDAPIYWTFWPATVFTASAAADLVKAMTSHRALMDLLDQTSIWATEEVVFPTVAALLGYELGLNPCSAAYVHHRAEYGLRDLAAALAQPDAYWIHPVPRSYDDRLRAAVRSLTHAGDYDRPLPPFAQMKKRTHVEAIDAALAAMSSVSGWLDQQEAAVLLRSAANTLSSAGPSPCVVEVGSYYGRSTVALGTLLSHVAHQGRLFAIDPHAGALSPGAAVSAAEDTWEPFSRNVALAGLTNVVVPVRTQAENVDIDVLVDVLFIDGFHDYPNVARDCLRFEPTVVDGGLVAFHDYSVHYPGVVTFVQELLSTRRFALVAREGSLVVLRKQPDRAPIGGEEDGDGEVRLAQGPAVRRARPRASCIMPTRDRPDWVDLALQCFEHQDFIQKELIIVHSGNQSVERLCKGRPRVLYH